MLGGGHKRKRSDPRFVWFLTSHIKHIYDVLEIIQQSGLDHQARGGIMVKNLTFAIKDIKRCLKFLYNVVRGYLNFHFCPPPQYALLHQLQIKCHYIVKILCKNMARTFGGCK